MEFFLLDPDYQCRRPILNTFFEERFQYKPFSTASCSKFSNSFLDSSWINEEKELLKSIDPSRIYEIHWLHAGKGQATMSRFGHSMLRLIICAPHRPTVGPDCLKDILHHRVLNFRASVEMSNISYTDGLRGRYPSILFVSDFMSVHNEYVSDEFRDLESLPLQLNRREIHRVYQAALETHWGYEGRYYFLSNNCATETLRLLRRALPHRDEIQDIQTDRPDTMFEKLAEVKFAVTKPKTEPYHYRSRFEFFHRQVAVLARHDPSLELNSIQDYEKLSRESRVRLAESVLQRQDVQLNRALYSLESRQYLRLFRALHAQAALELQNQIEKAETQSGNLGAQRSAARALFARYRSAGHLLGARGYSVPLRSEMDEFFAAAESEKFEQKRQQLKASQQEQVKKLNSPIVEELRWTATTLQRILRSLNLTTKLENILPQRE